MKKIYVYPEISIFELRPEEVFAANSNKDNCHAERGKKDCISAGLPSNSNPVP